MMKQLRTLVLAGMLAVVGLPFSAYAADISALGVVGRIQEQVNCEWSDKTVDTFKAGDPDTIVTGIVTTFLATQAVLEKAVAAKCNLIITHEPTFYHGQDDASQLGEDPILRDKQKFIADHGLVIWRFHDHIHRHNPDGIYEGMMDRLGWRQYKKPDERGVFTLPETTLGDLASRMKDIFHVDTIRFHVDTIRVIGDPNLKTTKIGFAAGAPSSITQMKLLQRDDVEILVAGETREWETVEYVRDAFEQGKRKAIILLGHAISEEAGMKHCADWLKEFVNEVPIQFIEAGNPFWTPK